MKVTVTKALKTSMLMTEELAKEFIKQLDVLVERKVKDLSISFDGVMILSLNFLIPLAEYLIEVDEQNHKDKTKITLMDMEKSHLDLLTEAVRVVKSEAR